MLSKSPAIDLLVLGGGIALAVFASDFVLFQGCEVLAIAIAIVGLILLVDVNGQFSLGHGAFFALGAYATAILVNTVGLPSIVAVPLAAGVVFGAGLVVGVPALRLEGVYLAIGTFVIGVATPVVLKLSVFEAWTGGVQGIYLDKPEAPFGLPLSLDRWMFLVIGAVAIAVYLATGNLTGSRSGRALRAIRENPTAAAALGMNVGVYKVLAFAISAALAGLAGSLNALVVQFVAPEAFTVQLSISLVVGLVIGSLAGVRGALIGAAFVVLLPNLAEQASKGLAGVIFGVVLIGVTCLMPTIRRVMSGR